MMKIQHLALFFLPCFLLGCQSAGEDKDALVYFFTDQDGSLVSVDGKKADENPGNGEQGNGEKGNVEQGFVTRTAPKEKEKSIESPRQGILYSFFGKFKTEKVEEPTPPSGKEAVAPRKVTPENGVGKESLVEMGPPSLSGGEHYPSIVEPNTPPKDAREVPLAKAYKVLDLGEEKIRVIDRGMGSVEAEDVKKLRKQEGR